MRLLKLLITPFRLFGDDNFKMGIILGLIAPILGFLTFKWYKFGIFSMKEFLQFIYLQPNHQVLTAGLSISLLANALIFTLYVNSHKDKTAKGIFITTAFYGVMILLIKAFS
jgi:hypothetical protein